MTVVVGVAIVHEGRVLAARRTAPEAVAGGWELPGGKVEVGETREAAGAREVAEELGCVVEVTGWLPGEVEVAAGIALVVGMARLVGGEPVPTEHDAVRWLRADQLDVVRWLPADRPFLEPLRAMMLS